MQVTMQHLPVLPWVIIHAQSPVPMGRTRITPGQSILIPPRALQKQQLTQPQDLLGFKPGGGRACGRD